MKVKVIVNADDCGKSVSVNAAIEQMLANHLITSTTVMANMDDLKGAKELYDKYRDIASFGVHLNLTEGSPLVESSALESLSFYKRTGDGALEFNGNEYRKNKFNSAEKEAVRNEIRTQIKKVQDEGIHVSHIDSHHHIHTAKSILPLVLDVAKEFGIVKVRNIRNYFPISNELISRKIWLVYTYYLYPSIKTTDVFCPYEEFSIKYSNGLKKRMKTLELMCHPGHSGENYIREIELMKSNPLTHSSWAELINYNEL